MSEEKVSLEFLAGGVAMLTDRINDLDLRMRSIEIEIRELKTRFGALEARFESFDQRFGIQEERMIRVLAILVRMAERQGLPPEGSPR